MASDQWTETPASRAQCSQKSGRRVLLNLLSGIFNILTGPMGRATPDRADGERHCGNQQQNYSFSHNLILLLEDKSVQVLNLSVK
jgi:hypothetical protein